MDLLRNNSEPLFLAGCSTYSVTKLRICYTVVKICDSFKQISVTGADSGYVPRGVYGKEVTPINELNICFMVILCINDIKLFIVQLMHVQSLLKQIKIKESAPTCFGLQGNHHKGASQRLAYYAAITLTTPVRPSMYPHEPSV